MATCEVATAPVIDVAPSRDELRRMERERLYPRITNPNWLVLRSRREIFRKWLQEISCPGATVLDIGGRIQPYRELIRDKGARYLSVDLLRTALVDVAANAALLPIRDHCADIVLCTQMLEYAPEPAKVVEEIYRVLKPGGCLLLSVPSLSIRDDDKDCWRFWPTALRHLLTNFAEVRIVPEATSIAGLFRTVNAGVCALAKYPVIRAAIVSTIVPLLNLVALGLDRLLCSDNDVIAVNYSVLAKK